MPARSSSGLQNLRMHRTTSALTKLRPHAAAPKTGPLVGVQDASSAAELMHVVSCKTLESHCTSWNTPQKRWPVTVTVPVAPRYQVTGVLACTEKVAGLEALLIPRLSPKPVMAPSLTMKRASDQSSPVSLREAGTSSPSRSAPANARHAAHFAARPTGVGAGAAKQWCIARSGTDRLDSGRAVGLDL